MNCLCRHEIDCSARRCSHRKKRPSPVMEVTISLLRSWPHSPASTWYRGDGLAMELPRANADTDGLTLIWSGSVLVRAGMIEERPRDACRAEASRGSSKKKEIFRCARKLEAAHPDIPKAALARCVRVSPRQFHREAVPQYQLSQHREDIRPLIRPQNRRTLAPEG